MVIANNKYWHVSNTQINQTFAVKKNTFEKQYKKNA